MFALLARLAADLSAAVDTVTWAIRSALFVNHVAVEFLAGCGRMLLDIVADSACQVRCALRYGLQDFFTFSTDVYSIFSFIILVIVSGFTHVCEAVLAAWLSAVGCVMAVFTGLLWFLRGIAVAVETIHWTVFTSVALIWSAVTLIGHSIIYMLCAIPRTIFLSACLLSNNLYVGLQATCNIVVETCRISLQSTVTVAYWIVATVADIPVDAYYGLAVYCLIHVSIKYLSKSQRFRRSSAQFLRAVKQMLRALHPVTWLWLDIRRSFVRHNQTNFDEDDRTNVEEDDASDEDDDVHDAVANPDPLVRPALRQDGRPLLGRMRTLMRRNSPQPSCARSEPPPPSPPPEILDEVFRLKRQLSLEKDNRLCIVCQDRDKCILVMPCRHLCLCRECSEEIDDMCPMCRNRIRQRLLVFS